MGLKEWGQGLELLTDYYYRYVKEHREGERWFTTGAIIGEKKKTTKRKNGKKIKHTSPVEIDLIAFLVDNNCKIKEIHAVQCKEEVNGSNVDELPEQFAINTVKKLLKRAGEKGILRKVIAYAKINPPAKEKLEKSKELDLLSFDNMITEMIDKIEKYRKKGRKGYEREAMGWFVATLYDVMALGDDYGHVRYVYAKNKTEEKNSQRKTNPRGSKGAKEAWKKMKTVRWLFENYKTEKAKQIMKKYPKLAKKVRKKIRNLGS